jgi:hypothetical protein
MRVGIRGLRIPRRVGVGLLSGVFLLSMQSAQASVLVAPESTSPGATTPGTVLEHSELPPSWWIPEVTSAAYRLTYLTTDASGRPAPSSGTVMVPRGTAPEGGWPVIAWAHGTTGIGDTCAPSVTEPSGSDEDRTYLASFLERGYAIVATDYVGLGTPGVHPYLNGPVAAHNIVDIVKAGQNLNRALPAGQRMSRSWVGLGHSQGGGAAVQTAHYATEFGGDTLDYRGTVATGTPVFLDQVMRLLGTPIGVPSTSSGTTTFVAYLLAGIRANRPDLAINSVLSEDGQRLVTLAETACLEPMRAATEGVTSNDLFTAPLVSVPGAEQVLHDWLAMPSSGFDRPLFLGHGLLDTTAPYALTALYAGSLTLNGAPLTFRTYATDHGGVLETSSADSLPFIAHVFAA